MERDLAALGDKIRQLDETANRLMQTHPEAADTIYGKQREINELWTQLTAKVQCHLYLLYNVISLNRVSSFVSIALQYHNQYSFIGMGLRLGI